MREKFKAGEYSELVIQSPRVIFTENSQGALKLSSIEFEFFDRLFYTESGITYIPEHGYSKTLTYPNWDIFLKYY